MSASDTPQPQPAAPVGFFSLATAGALVMVIIWGGSPFVTKLGVASLDGFALALLRTIASIPFAVLIIALMRLPLPWRGRDKLLIVGVGITGVIGFPVLFTLGVALTTAGHAAVVTAATPIFVGLLESLVSRVLPTRRWWIGVTIAFAGAVILIAEAIGLEGSGATWQGDLLVAAGGLAAASSFVMGARLTPRYGAVGVTMWGVVIATVTLLPFLGAVYGSVDWAAVQPAGWFAVVYLSAGSTIVAYITWIYALSRGGIARMSVYQFFLPVVGVAFAAIFLAEPLTPPLLVATVVILVGVGLVQRR
jgi:drug/metabolite transporter (DMT)-like permease